MLYTKHTELFDIGYEGIHPIEEIIENTKELTDTFSDFFNELDEEHYLTLRQRIVPDHKTIQYYLEVQMSDLLAPAFILYFGSDRRSTH